MELNTAERDTGTGRAATDLIEVLRRNEQEYDLREATLYQDFPIYRTDDDGIIESKLLVVSKHYGVIAFGTSEATDSNVQEELTSASHDLDQVFSCIYSRMIRNKELRKTRTELKFPMRSAIYSPFVSRVPDGLSLDGEVISSERRLTDFLEQSRGPDIEPDVYKEVVATLEGSKGLIRSRPRDIQGKARTSKGVLAAQLESQIAGFDKKQKHGFIRVLDGPQRIRGLAGSGKTVVLAMKAALTHLREPEKRILYTFHTKSLYQHIQRLITRFYRQFEDKDPDWSRLQILHGWGGRSSPGVYYNACRQFGVVPLSYGEATAKTSRNALDFACKELLKTRSIGPSYDYVFVDEGQDFPASFIRMCAELAEKNRIVWAYDELQSIFQVSTPSPSQIFGADRQGRPRIELSDDVVLYKCYRNPREILLCAHALGFGLYGPSIVQMLENKEHWEDLGYVIRSGDFKEGEEVVIERPEENSLTAISKALPKSEIVCSATFAGVDDEIAFVADSIRKDLGEGLRPDDILVVVVDDRHSKLYLENIAKLLSESGIQTNNMHVDSYGIKDFYLENHVTLSTVHKAKGNEAFVVYVVGVDALFWRPDVRARNMLFISLTRAKGWVRVTGVGQPAEDVKKEIDKALENVPFLRFKYPSPEQILIMKRDLAAESARKQNAARKLDEVLKDLTAEEIAALLRQRTSKKGKIG